MSEPLIISYPHYCHRCYFAYVSARRNAPCPKCGKGDQVHNCFGEVSIPTEWPENLRRREYPINVQT
jgi:hypothetical protein